MSKSCPLSNPGGRPAPTSQGGGHRQRLGMTRKPDKIGVRAAASVESWLAPLTGSMLEGSGALSQQQISLAGEDVVLARLFVRYFFPTRIGHGS